MLPGRPRFALRRVCAFAFVAGVTLAMPAGALAGSFKKDTTPLPQSIGQAGAAQASSGGGGTSSFMRLGIGLVLVLGLVWAIQKVVKRSQKSGVIRGGGDGIDVVATAALAPNRAVHLLRVGDELVLVGSSEQGVTRLRSYDADEAQRLIADLSMPSGPIGPRSWTDTIDAIRRKTAR